MKLEPVAAHLEGQGLTNVFINNAPAKAKSAVLLKAPYNGATIDYELPGYRKTSFQMVARAPTYAAGEALIEQAMAAITLNEVQLTGLYVKYMRPRHDPIPFPPTPGGEVEFLVNIDVCVVIG